MCQTERGGGRHLLPTCAHCSQSRPLITVTTPHRPMIMPFYHPCLTQHRQQYRYVPEKPLKPDYHSPILSISSAFPPPSKKNLSTFPPFPPHPLSVSDTIASIRCQPAGRWPVSPRPHPAKRQTIRLKPSHNARLQPRRGGQSPQRGLGERPRAQARR
ncbi:hypothetical protein BC826DRAFT_1055194 [Russula brevipes]|nr:hypothetical protein BC826DRAFT_1055194 [Russula brevipes]